MAWLKNTLLASAFLLTACAAKFDPVEHGRVIDIKHQASEALARGHCADHNMAKTVAERINSDTAWLVFYSQHIPKNQSMETMSLELQRITQEFAQRYQTGTPSRVYCELKLKNIITVVGVIQQTNARRAR